MNEAETRAEHIDPALKAAGWGVVDGSRILREYPIAPGRIEGGGKKGKAEIADYVLVYKNTKLAVVEAKAWGKPLTEGVAQAKSYAGKLETVGVEELDKDKLTPLLKLRYHDSIPDAVKDLGMPAEISKVFSGFQKFLYSGDVA